MKVKDALQSWPAQTAATTACLFLVCLALAWYSYGSPRVAYAVLRGAVVTPDSYVQQATPATNGEGGEARFRLKNWSDRPVRLTGAGVSCTCVLVQSLPLTIPARGETPFGVAIHPRPTAKPAQARPNQHVTIYTDDPRQPTLSLEVASERGFAAGAEAVQ